MVGEARVFLVGWVVALFRIKRLIKEAIETPSSPIAVLQEAGQLVSTHCPAWIV